MRKAFEDEMSESKPWRAAIAYRWTRWLVGYFDTAEEAQRQAEHEARMRSEDLIRHLEVDHKDGAAFRQIWGGRSPRGDWYLHRNAEYPSGGETRTSEGEDLDNLSKTPLPFIRRWVQESPSTIVIEFVRDLTTREAAAVPAKLAAITRNVTDTEREVGFLRGMEEAARLLDEERASADSLIAAAGGDRSKYPTLDVQGEAARLMAENIRHFASDADWRKAVLAANTACEHEWLSYSILSAHHGRQYCAKCKQERLGVDTGPNRYGGRGLVIPPNR